MAQQDNYNPVVVSNDAGYAVAIWGNNSTGFMEGSVYTSGIWMNAGIIPNTEGAFASPPLVTMDATGNVTVVWADYFSSNIRATTLPFGGSWSDPVVISPEGDYGYYCTTPSISMDSSGNVTAVWSNVSTGTAQASTLSVGGTWSTPVDLN